MKYILVHGGVISGVGKGIISSSIGTLMKSLGLRVTAIKIDPYINIDAGTFNPYEHGEVGEVDMRRKWHALCRLLLETCLFDVWRLYYIETVFILAQHFNFRKVRTGYGPKRYCIW